MLQPRHRRLLARIAMRGVEAAELAAHLLISPTRLGVYLSNLRALGAGMSAAIHFPARAGRPVETLTYVAVDKARLDALATFEAHCRSEPRVTTAVALAGDFDYALWGFHPDAQAARDWLRGLEQRPEVRRTRSSIVRILFGHTFDGGVIFGAASRAPAVAAARARRAASAPEVSCPDACA